MPQMSKQQFAVIVVVSLAIVVAIIYSTYSANIRADERLRFDKERESHRDLFRP